MGIPRIYILLITIQICSMITAQEMSKRVPQGFLGMRGKKYFDDGSDELYKRKPQFFVGVKGKKSLSEILEIPEEFYKRTPMGFMGMRGKKDASDNIFLQNGEIAPKRDGSLIGQIDYSSNENEEFPLLNELLTQYLQKMERNSNEASNDIYTDVTNEVDKRAANMHQFFGVRGKKSLNNKRPYDLSFRGKFIGVRGKKDLKNSGAQEIKFLLDNGPLPKRKGQMGFFGMRGKKWADDSSPEMETPN